jgi:signal transduction histidine kinase
MNDRPTPQFLSQPKGHVEGSKGRAGDGRPMMDDDRPSVASDSVIKGLSMIPASRSHTSRDPAEIASVLRLLAEAPDRRSFFATLRGALPRLLPGTRVDILANEPHDGAYVLFTSGREASSLLPAGKRTAAGFAEWLGSQGYDVVATLPLTGAGQHLGWLLLARRRDAHDRESVALAGQLAAMIGLRLMYDQCRDDLAERDAYTALLDLRLRDVEEMRLRATMAAGAAHDIGNLFASVLGYAEILEQSAPTSMLPDLRTIARAAHDGQQLMRRVLAIRTPQVALSSMPVALLPTVIRDAIKLTQPFWEVRPEITVKTALAPIPPVRGNAVELREVLVNLIMNAIAAMPEGGVLSVHARSVDEQVLVEVTDTGEGIAREYQGTIFQPFVTTREAGNGLGLSTSRAIVESYGGTLTVESTPGQGATFTFSLPAVRSLDAFQEVQPASCQKCAAM